MIDSLSPTTPFSKIFFRAPSEPFIILEAIYVPFRYSGRGLTSRRISIMLSHSYQIGSLDASPISSAARQPFSSFSRISCYFPMAPEFRFTSIGLHDNPFHPFVHHPSKDMGNTLIQHGMTVLLLCGWIGITAGAGRFFLSKTGLRPSSLGEALFLSAGIGIPVVGYAIFLLGVANALHPSSLYLTLFSLSLLSAVGWSRPLGILPAPASGKRGTERTASAALGILLLCGLMMALTPEIGKDALIYHLAVPKR